MPPAGHRPVSPQRAIRVVPRREGDEPTRRDVRPADVAGAPAVDGSVAVQCAGVVLPRIDRRERPCGRLELAEVVLTSTDDRAAGAQSARIRLTDAYRREAVVGRRRHRARGAPSRPSWTASGPPLGGGGEEAPAGQLPVAPGTVSLALLEPELDPAALELGGDNPQLHDGLVFGRGLLARGRERDRGDGAGGNDDRQSRVHESRRARPPGGHRSSMSGVAPTHGVTAVSVAVAPADAGAPILPCGRRVGAPAGHFAARSIEQFAR